MEKMWLNVSAKMDKFLVIRRDTDRLIYGLIYTPKPRSFRYRVLDSWNGFKSWVKQLWRWVS